MISLTEAQPVKKPNAYMSRTVRAIIKLNIEISQTGDDSILARRGQ